MFEQTFQKRQEKAGRMAQQVLASKLDYLSVIPRAHVAEENYLSNAVP